MGTEELESRSGLLPYLGEMVCADAHGSHRVAYARWGNDGHGLGRFPPVIAVHGLTRNGRDFDSLASSLARSRSVICPDIVGRGRSDWLEHAGDYGYPTYLADCEALISEMTAGQVDWVGTSMGGLIGLLLATRPPSPVRRLVLNDVGPFIPKAALERIGSYVGRTPPLPDPAAVEDHLRGIHGSFGPLTDEQQAHLARYSAAPLPDGTFRLDYDPAIAGAFRGELGDVDLWEIYDRIRCPTLVLRGAVSDVLSGETAREMTKRGPRAALIEFAGVGHAPALVDPGQIAAVQAFLETDLDR